VGGDQDFLHRQKEKVQGKSAPRKAAGANPREVEKRRRVKAGTKKRSIAVTTPPYLDSLWPSVFRSNGIPGNRATGRGGGRKKEG